MMIKNPKRGGASIRKHFSRMRWPYLHDEGKDITIAITLNEQYSSFRKEYSEFIERSNVLMNCADERYYNLRDQVFNSEKNQQHMFNQLIQKKTLSLLADLDQLNSYVNETYFEIKKKAKKIIECDTSKQTNLISLELAIDYFYNKISMSTKDIIVDVYFFYQFVVKKEQQHQQQQQQQQEQDQA